MIQVIRFHTRQFHVTSKTLVRRIIHRNSDGSEEHKDFSQSVDIASANQEPNCDYLGIESDEGAITLRSQNHFTRQDTRISGRVKERFHRAAYGVIRYDSENKPKFHGQYENRMDFTFPYHSSDDVEVHSNIKSSPDGQLRRIKSFSNAKPNFIRSEIEGDISKCVPLNEASEDMNYVDEYYFGDSKIGSSSNDNRSEKSTSDELNFIDKYYFGNEIVAELSSTAERDVSKSNINARDISFNITEDLSSSNDSAMSDFNKHNTAEKSTLDEMNFMDSNYFKNVNAAADQVFEKIDSTKSVTWCSTNISEIDYSKGLNDNLNFSRNLNPSDSLKDNSVHSHLPESAMQKLVTSNNIEQIVTEEGYPMHLEVNELDRTQELNQKITEHSSQSILSKPKIFSNRLKQELKSKKSMTQVESESDPDSKKPFSKKNDFNHSSSTPEESSEIEQVSTAHDFVAKLRKEQKVPNQSYPKAMTGSATEKVDSKGFRILKSQVQDLSQLTRSEVIHLLKKNIVYSDDDLMVLNKPYSLVIHESKTTKEPCLSMYLDDLAKEMDPEATNPKLFTVHRLDKETTGCLLLARNETMAQNLTSLFAQRKIVKKYWIITIRVPDPVKGIIDMPISEGSIQNRKRMVLHPKLPKDVPYKSHSRNGRPAVTSFEVISESGNAALVEVTPVTGVKHQIRVHFGFGLGCPILGDHKYSFLDKLVPQKLPADLLQRLHVRQSKVRHIPMHIHAKSVMIPNYFEGRNLFVNIPLPDHMIANLKRLKFKKK